MSSTYTAKNIDVLEGIEAVRKRPGMYIGGTGSDGLHHLLWEIVDNSVDEAMNGHATTITVTLHGDGATATVEDNGRGIPVDEHPKHKKSALEVILTTLHAGGKFSSMNYKTSGGLHGVGSSAVNALSVKFSARVKRDGQEWEQHYRKGRPKAPVEPIGPARGTGTRITFTPDPTIFDDTQFDSDRLCLRLSLFSCASHWPSSGNAGRARDDTERLALCTAPSPPAFDLPSPSPPAAVPATAAAAGPPATGAAGLRLRQ